MHANFKERFERIEDLEKKLGNIEPIKKNATSFYIVETKKDNFENPGEIIEDTYQFLFEKAMKEYGASGITYFDYLITDRYIKSLEVEATPVMIEGNHDLKKARIFNGNMEDLRMIVKSLEICPPKNLYEGDRIKMKIDNGFDLREYIHETETRFGKEGVKRNAKFLIDLDYNFEYGKKLPKNSNSIYAWAIPVVDKK